MASEIIMDVRYAQSLARGVVWEGDALATNRPKIIYVELLNNATNNGIIINTFAAAESQPRIRARRVLERGGFTISQINTSGAVQPFSGRLLIAFSIPRGEASVGLISANPVKEDFNCPGFYDDLSTDPCKLKISQTQNITITIRDTRGNERDITVDWLTGKINA
jgi:hypothetical protein